MTGNSEGKLPPGLENGIIKRMKVQLKRKVNR